MAVSSMESYLGGQFSVDGDFSLITFEEDGQSVPLLDEPQCVAAVERGRVKIDTRVTVYNQGKSTAMAAGDFPLFSRLFRPDPVPSIAVAEAAPPAALPEVPRLLVPEGRAGDAKRAADKSVPSFRREGRVPTPDPAATVQIRAVPPVTVPKSPPVKAPPSVQRILPEPGVPPRPAAAPPPAPTPLPPPKISAAPRLETKKPISSALIVLGVVLVALYAFLSARSKKPTTPPPTVSAGPETPAIAPPKPVVDPDADLPSLTLYAARDVSLWSRPDTASDSIRRSRGSEFTGVAVDDPTDTSVKWLKIKSGTDAGRFIPMAGLSSTRPPELDTGFKGDQEILTPAKVRIAPRDDADAIPTNSDLARGAIVSVMGTVGKDWAEIALGNGGVGYVRTDAFVAPEETETPSPVASADPPQKPVVVPVSRPVTHDIIVTNNCKIHSISVAIYYRSASGWQDSGGAYWNYTPGYSAYPNMNDARISAIDDNIYFAVTKIDGQAQDPDGTNTVGYGGKSMHMNKAKITYRPNGDYEIIITCSN